MLWLGGKLLNPMPTIHVLLYIIIVDQVNIQKMSPISEKKNVMLWNDLQSEISENFKQ